MVLAYARAMAAGERPCIMRVGGNTLYIAIDARANSISQDLVDAGCLALEPVSERNRNGRTCIEAGVGNRHFGDVIR